MKLREFIFMNCMLKVEETGENGSDDRRCRSAAKVVVPIYTRWILCVHLVVIQAIGTPYSAVNGL